MLLVTIIELLMSNHYIMAQVQCTSIVLGESREDLDSGRIWTVGHQHEWLMSLQKRMANVITETPPQGNLF